MVSDSKNRSEWRNALVCELLKGNYQVFRGVRMIVNNRIWGRHVQLMCPLEIKSQMSSEELNKRIQAANKDAAKTAKLENSDQKKNQKGWKDGQDENKGGCNVRREVLIIFL